MRALLKRIQEPTVVKVEQAMLRMVILALLIEPVKVTRVSDGESSRVKSQLSMSLKDCTPVCPVRERVPDGQLAFDA